MIRTKKIPFIQSTAAMPILLLTSAIMAIGIYLPFSSLAEIVRMERLPWGYFPWLVGFLLTYCVLTQAIKTWYIRKFKSWL
jgi:Mg2+-importing ATPase